MSRKWFPPQTNFGWVLFGMGVFVTVMLLAAVPWAFTNPHELEEVPNSFEEALATAQADPENYWFVFCADSEHGMVVETPSHFTMHLSAVFTSTTFPEGVACGVYYRHLPMDEPFLQGFTPRCKHREMSMWMCMQRVPHRDNGAIHKQCMPIPRIDQVKNAFGVHLFAENPNDTSTPLYRLKRQDALADEQTASAVP